MMKWDNDKKIIVMDLMDLEHCGFNYEEYLGELHLHGIDNESAENPIAIIVNFAGGHVLFGEQKESELKEYKKKNVEFDEFINKSEDMDLIG